MDVPNGWAVPLRSFFKEDCPLRIRYFMRRAFGPVLRPIAFSVLKLFSQHRRICDLDIWLAADVADPSLPFERVENALLLVKGLDSTRFTRIKHYLGPIIILDIQDAGQLPDLRACVVGISSVVSIPCSRLAATLVHEATHARIRAAGVPMRVATIGREEVLCTREAIRFLERVPGGESEAERMKRLLQNELAKDQPWYYHTLR